MFMAETRMLAKKLARLQASKNITDPTIQPTNTARKVTIDIASRMDTLVIPPSEISNSFAEGFSVVGEALRIMLEDA